MVKKSVSIIFFSIYLLSTNAALLELAKLPLLAEHYSEHKKWNPDISFISFIWMHYLDDDNKYADQARDQQMPFKTTYHPSLSLAGFIVPSPEYAIVPKISVRTQKQRLITDSYIHSSQYLSSIWQPPRLG